MSKPELIQPLFLPRGVAELSGKIGYVTNATNGIDAINLNNGKTLWITSEASYPLIATNNWLVAQKSLPGQSNAFQIVKLDSEKNGRVLLLSELVVFPDWVMVYSPNEQDFSFTIQYSEPVLELSWQAQSHYRGGANPPSFIVQHSAQQDRGTARIDMQSGKVEMLPSTNPITEQHSTISIEEQFGSGWWVAGQNLAVLIWAESQGEQVLQLKTRPKVSNRMIERVIELVKGKALASYVTPDGCYVLVHSELSEQLQPKQKRPWWIFSAETGHLLAILDYEEGTQASTILKHQIFYLVEEPKSAPQGKNLLQSVLKSKDLTTKKLLWKKLLQEKPLSKFTPLPQ